MLNHERVTRRSFGAASTAFIATGYSIGHSRAQDQDPFVCMTPQFTQNDTVSASEVQLRPTAAPGISVELNTAPLSADALKLGKYQLLLRTDAWQQSDSLPGPPNKIRIAVHFLDGTDFQRQAVQKYASEWLVPAGANRVEFVFGSPDRRHIRISFNTDLNQSAHGRQALQFPQPGPTMWLADVRPNVAADRVAAVIRHEFGHALGMRHEHQHPFGGIKWNRDVVIAYHTKFPGWTTKKVEEQIFNIYTDSSYMCSGSPGFDPKSIMMYPVPPGWAQNIVVPYNINIIPADYQCVHGAYV